MTIFKVLENSQTVLEPSPLKFPGNSSISHASLIYLAEWTLAVRSAPSILRYLNRRHGVRGTMSNLTSVNWWALTWALALSRVKSINWRHIGMSFVGPALLWTPPTIIHIQSLRPGDRNAIIINQPVHNGDMRPSCGGDVKFSIPNSTMVNLEMQTASWLIRKMRKRCYQQGHGYIFQRAGGIVIEYLPITVINYRLSIWPSQM